MVKSIKEIAAAYSVCRRTFIKMIQPIIKLQPHQRILTPKQVQEIENKLGSAERHKN